MATKILVGVTGSVAAYKACDVIRALRSDGVVVEALLTEAGARFISPTLLAALTGRPVSSDLFDVGRDGEMPHIRLASSASVLVIVPATAHTIAKLAGGAADDLLSCVALATRAPIVMVPAMNEGMFTHPAVQRNCRILREWGVRFVGPVEGELACGIRGRGHLAPVEEIVRAVREAAG